MDFLSRTSSLNFVSLLEINKGISPSSKEPLHLPELQQWFSLSSCCCCSFVYCLCTDFTSQCKTVTSLSWNPIIPSSWALLSDDFKNTSRAHMDQPIPRTRFGHAQHSILLGLPLSRVLQDHCCYGTQVEWWLHPGRSEVRASEPKEH